MEAAPQLHAVVSTWLSCMELPIQQLFFGICADPRLILFKVDTNDVYAHFFIPNDTYLAVNDAYSEW